MQAIELLNSFSHGKWLYKTTNSIIIDSLEWKIQETNSSAILFLKTTSNVEVNKLIKILNKDNVGIVISDSLSMKDNLNNEIPFYYCEDKYWFELQEKLANLFYPFAADLKFAAVTGTNGKTSTVYFLSQVLNQKNSDILSIGTLGVYLNQKKVKDFALTSPSYIDFRKVVHQYALNGCIIVFEMSSHALIQKRFFNISLDVAAWTSFSQDHLDYHKDMESYFNAKKSILDYLKKNAKLFIPLEQSEIFEKIKNDPRVIKCGSWNEYRFETNNPIFMANFAKDNFILAFEMAKEILKTNVLNINLNTINNAPGRWLLKSFENRLIIIDYAHTPDALVNVCENAKQAFAKYKIKVLFGCGGDRDRAKRPLMGQAVSKFAEYIYVTSDNPRTEDAEKIIDDIIPGISQKYFRDADREKTLIKALEELQSGEVLIVAGKGHENYIIKGTVKHPYSDEGVCDKFIESKNKKVK